MLKTYALRFTQSPPFSRQFLSYHRSFNLFLITEFIKFVKNPFCMLILETCVSFFCDHAFDKWCKTAGETIVSWHHSAPPSRRRLYCVRDSGHRRILSSSKERYFITLVLSVWPRESITIWIPALFRKRVVAKVLRSTWKPLFTTSYRSGRIQ